MATITYYRDTVICTSALLSSLGRAPGDTILIAAKNLTIASLLPDYNYLFLTDELRAQNNAPIRLQVAPNNPTPQFTVLARSIVGNFSISSKGMTGAKGVKGAPGRNANCHGGEPGTDGRMGHKGGDGLPGGTLTIHYVQAENMPVANSVGGDGGPGGDGGDGGSGCSQGAMIFFSGSQGPNGPRGEQGPAGPVVVSQRSVEELWSALTASQAVEWAAYRTKVGAYYYRIYDAASLKLAVIEFKTALFLDAANHVATQLLTQIVQQQVPSGLPRDYDIALDYPALAANSKDSAQLLQQLFASFQNTADTAQLR